MLLYKKTLLIKVPTLLWLLMILLCGGSPGPSRLKARSKRSMDVSSDLLKQPQVIVANGFIPPQTYQRQVHRMAAKAAKQCGSGGKLRSTVARENGSGEVKTGGGDGNVSLHNIRLCPLRHKVTEVCGFCTARWVSVTTHSQLVVT